MGIGWIVFALVIAGMLVLDLGVFHRRPHAEGLRAAALWSVFWISLGLLFGLFIYLTRSPEAAYAYLTAFLIEKSLSVDNLFVFLALFTYFGVRDEVQHRVLFWGILGALVTRGAFIFAGVALLARFHWLVFVLGILLVATGARLAFKEDEDDVHPERNVIVRWASRVLPIERSYNDGRFTVRTSAGLRLTPLILVLIAIETTDVMFAVDSVPAVLAVSRDVFVVYTSNIFAILGLRALYFVLMGAMRSLRWLRPALATVLALIGAKMLLSDVVEIPTLWSLAAVGAILAGATVLSIAFPSEPEQDSQDAP